MNYSNEFPQYYCPNCKCYEIFNKSTKDNSYNCMKCGKYSVTILYKNKLNQKEQSNEIDNLKKKITELADLYDELKYRIDYQITPFL